MAQWKFYIDRGGTFTDIIAVNPNGELLTHKLLSEQPQQYSDASIAGIHALMGGDEQHAIAADQIERIRMGTTIGTNALLERKGEPRLFVTNKGYADTLRIGFQNRPKLFDLNIKLTS